jgi:hypothetical protein
MPALAHVLAKHHGFKCTMLFTVDAKSGVVVPDNSNSPGLEALATVDLAVAYLRFSDFPTKRMKHMERAVSQKLRKRIEEIFAGRRQRAASARAAIALPNAPFCSPRNCSPVHQAGLCVFKTFPSTRIER